MFELYYRMTPVVILSGNKGRWDVFETANAHTLMREFQRLGEERVRIRGVISSVGILHPRSLNALNCFLRHGEGLRFFKRGETRGAKYHRFAWYDFQKYLALRWVS